MEQPVAMFHSHTEYNEGHNGEMTSYKFLSRDVLYQDMLKHTQLSLFDQQGTVKQLVIMVFAEAELQG